jgi:NAD(P)H-nitrite reductase large subunit
LRVETNVEVLEILNERGWVSGVRLKDGRLFPCQRVIEAVGVRPNIQFLAGSGIHLREGILVNECMETNLSGVYAAGDVAMTIDSITSEWVNNATWSAAARQGRVAGSNMAGGDQRYLHNFNLNSTDLFGLRVMAAGHPYHESQSGLNVFIHEGRESYRKVVIRDGRLIGFILIGDVSGAGFLVSLMKRGIELSRDEWDDLLSSRTSRYDLPPHLGFDHGFLFQRAEEIGELL